MEHIDPVIFLVAGVLIFFMPRILNYTIAAYLIVIGGLRLLGQGL